MSRTWLGLGFAASLAACATGAGDEFSDDGVKQDPASTPADEVARAAEALPDVEVRLRNVDGVPTYIQGELGKIDPAHLDDRLTPDAALRPALTTALAPFRLRADDLRLRKVNVDEQGNRAFRYRQVFDGLDVIGGDLVVHVDVKGAIFGINGSARGDIPATLGKRDIGLAGARASVADDARFGLMTQVGDSRLVYLITPAGAMHKAYELTYEGMRGADPALDKIFVDVDSGAIVAVHPQIHFARSRRVHSANNGTSLPGTLRRSEGDAPTSDVDVNAAYDNSGSTYDFYDALFSRDSYNNAGATLISTVHYSVQYCNAFWNGTQMVYGDGDGPTSNECRPLARSVDVAAHELTHAVTQNESNLVYSGESGGLNEALSDIFGAATEAWVDGGSTGTTLLVSAETWLIGEDILPPALRYMNDPAADGVSLDFWTSNAGNVDVHFNSGIANLAFYLLSQGGRHPRGKSTNLVAGIGMEKAARIFYKANADILTSNATFADARLATVQAATALGYSSAEIASVGDAWTAVGVLPPPEDVVLTNGVAITGISGGTGSLRYYKLEVPTGQSSLSFVLAGGTGDADMYVQRGSKPTTSSYLCRPYLNGNNETCSFSSPAAGTWYVMLRGYTSYSGTSLKGTYTGSTQPPDDGVPILVNGSPVGSISGASGSTKYWKIQTPAGRRLVITISGGSGDADLYTRFGQKPTTSSYLCRPYTSGNNETCTVSSTQSGTYYIMLRGYRSYSGVTLKGTY
jgi:vibriolysin